MGLFIVGCSDTSGDGGHGDDGDGDDGGHAGTVGWSEPTVTVAAHRLADRDRIIVSTMPVTCEDPPTSDDFYANFECPSFYFEIEAPVGRIAVGAVIGDEPDEEVFKREFGAPFPDHVMATASCSEEMGHTPATITVDALADRSITVTFDVNMHHYPDTVDGPFEGAWCRPAPGQP
jgi:hypothetical protein